MWAYADAALAATPLSRECHGGALVVRCLHDLPAALAELERVRAQTGVPPLPQCAARWAWRQDATGAAAGPGELH